METSLQQIEELADSSTEDRAFYMVGAGLSIDSEVNFQDRFFQRLLAMLLGLLDTLGDPDVERKVVRRLREKPGFDLKAYRALKLQKRRDWINRDMVPCTYEFNTLFCELFGQLLATFSTRGRRPVSRPAKLGKKWLAAREPDLPNIQNWLFGDSSRKIAGASWFDYGKILFLETMGFGDSEIMGGIPQKTSRKDLLASYRISLPGAGAAFYGSRILPRHEVIARLAREGCIPDVGTTNFDLLLEGGFRLAGFDLQSAGDGRHLAALSTLHRSSCAADNAGSGKPGAVALFKVHGCVDGFRLRMEAVEGCQPNSKTTRIRELCDYLNQMVYTYRPLQHWRDEPWAQDNLRSLFRRRQTVFLCYGGLDTVIHSTFREVSEETRNTSRAWVVDPSPESFWTRQMLDAFESESCLNSHRRALDFSYFNSDPQKKRLPDIDHLLMIKNHLIVRHIQRQHLDDYLGDLWTRQGQIGRHPLKIERAFDRMCDRELKVLKALLQAASTNPKHWERLNRLLGWTWHWHPALIREHKFALLQQQHTSLNWSEYQVGRSHVYVGMKENPLWTAWGVVLEMAVRKLVSPRHPRRLGSIRFESLHEEALPTLLYRTKSKSWCGLRLHQSGALSNRRANLVHTRVPVKSLKLWECDGWSVIDPTQRCSLSQDLWKWAAGTTNPAATPYNLPN